MNHFWAKAGARNAAASDSDDDVFHDAVTTSNTPPKSTTTKSTTAIAAAATIITASFAAEDDDDYETRSTSPRAQNLNTSILSCSSTTNTTNQNNTSMNSLKALAMQQQSQSHQKQSSFLLLDSSSDSSCGGEGNAYDDENDVSKSQDFSALMDTSVSSFWTSILKTKTTTETETETAAAKKYDMDGKHHDNESVFSMSAADQENLRLLEELVAAAATTVTSTKIPKKNTRKSLMAKPKTTKTTTTMIKGSNQPTALSNVSSRLNKTPAATSLESQKLRNNSCDARTVIKQDNRQKACKKNDNQDRTVAAVVRKEGSSKNGSFISANNNNTSRSSTRSRISSITISANTKSTNIQNEKSVSVVTRTTANDASKSTLSSSKTNTKNNETAKLNTISNKTKQDPPASKIASGMLNAKKKAVTTKAAMETTVTEKATASSAMKMAIPSSKLSAPKKTKLKIDRFSRNGGDEKMSNEGGPASSTGAPSKSALVDADSSCKEEEQQQNQLSSETPAVFIPPFWASVLRDETTDTTKNDPTLSTSTNNKLTTTTQREQHESNDQSLSLSNSYCHLDHYSQEEQEHAQQKQKQKQKPETQSQTKPQTEKENLRNMANVSSIFHTLQSQTQPQGLDTNTNIFISKPQQVQSKISLNQNTNTAPAKTLANNGNRKSTRDTNNRKATDASSRMTKTTGSSQNAVSTTKSKPSNINTSIGDSASVSASIPAVPVTPLSSSQCLSSSFTSTGIKKPVSSRSTARKCRQTGMVTPSTTRLSGRNIAQQVQQQQQPDQQKPKPPAQVEKSQLMTLRQSSSTISDLTVSTVNTMGSFATAKTTVTPNAISASAPAALLKNVTPSPSSSSASLYSSGCVNKRNNSNGKNSNEIVNIKNLKRRKDDHDVVNVSSSILIPDDEYDRVLSSISHKNNKNGDNTDSNFFLVDTAAVSRKIPASNEDEWLFAPFVDSDGEGDDDNVCLFPKPDDTVPPTTQRNRQQGSMASTQLHQSQPSKKQQNYVHVIENDDDEEDEEDDDDEGSVSTCFSSIHLICPDMFNGNSKGGGETTKLSPAISKKQQVSSKKKKKKKQAATRQQQEQQQQEQQKKQQEEVEKILALAELCTKGAMVEPGLNMVVQIPQKQQQQQQQQQQQHQPPLQIDILSPKSSEGCNRSLVNMIHPLDRSLFDEISIVQERSNEDEELPADSPVKDNEEYKDAFCDDDEKYLHDRLAETPVFFHTSFNDASLAIAAATKDIAAENQSFCSTSSHRSSRSRGPLDRIRNIFKVSRRNSNNISNLSHEQSFGDDDDLCSVGSKMSFRSCRSFASAATADGGGGGGPWRKRNQQKEQPPLSMSSNSSVTSSSTRTSLKTGSVVATRKQRDRIAFRFGLSRPTGVSSRQEIIQKANSVTHDQQKDSKNIYNVKTQNAPNCDHPLRASVSCKTPSASVSRIARQTAAAASEKVEGREPTCIYVLLLETKRQLFEVCAVDYRSDLTIADVLAEVRTKATDDALSTQNYVGLFNTSCYDNSERASKLASPRSLVSNLFPITNSTSANGAHRPPLLTAVPEASNAATCCKITNLLMQNPRVKEWLENSGAIIPPSVPSSTVSPQHADGTVSSKQKIPSTSEQKNLAANTKNRQLSSNLPPNDLVTASINRRKARIGREDSSTGSASTISTIQSSGSILSNQTKLKYHHLQHGATATTAAASNIPGSRLRKPRSSHLPKF